MHIAYYHKWVLAFYWGDLRTKEEIELLAQRDPLKTVTVDEGTRREIEQEIDRAIEEVLATPVPDMPKGE